MTVEARMTISNMTIEAGARAGLIGPDDPTIEFLRGRPFAPAGEQWDDAVRAWRGLASEPGCAFDRQLSIDAAAIAPTVTWGTSPEHTAEVTGSVPAPADFAEPSVQRRVERALDYMGLAPGTRIADIAIDQVFIGSCTNSRIEDLRLAAQVVAGKKAVIPAMIVPGSRAVRAQAEAEGLAELFRAAGFDWREPGCSMCLGMNGDLLSAGTRCASTSNRNFEGRQGRGARTHLVSPAMAAAAAVTGRLVDVRELA
jgi:3-isopropylmalate/(R)-2-methylmalate dehydratase large subunit